MRFEWGITACSTRKMRRRVPSFGNLTGIMINKKSEHKDLAWEYVLSGCAARKAR